MLEYGAVICREGKHKGRIGYCDALEIDCSRCLSECCSKTCDQTDVNCEDCERYTLEHGKCHEFAIIYWGDMLADIDCELVPEEYCTNEITMQDVIERISTLRNTISRLKNGKKKSLLLLELSYVEKLYYEKHIISISNKEDGKKLFISYSTKDKNFANCLYADLKNHGHTPWLDERDICVGQTIPAEIQIALKNTDYILVILSPNSVNSSWVSSEWQTVYWDEVCSKRTKVIPILFETCEMPPFLKIKKYADFRYDYQTGLTNLLKAFAE